LRADWLSALPGWLQAAKVPDDIQPLRLPPEKEGEEAKVVPFWRPETKAAALGATLGVGALGTLILPLMQGYDAFKIERQNNQLAFVAALKATRESLFDADGKLVPTMPVDGAQNLRRVITASRSGGVEAGLRHEAVEVDKGLVEKCTVPDETAPYCEASTHPVCEIVCKRDIGDGYWEPAPASDWCRNRLFSWMEDCAPPAVVAMTVEPPREVAFEPSSGIAGTLMTSSIRRQPAGSAADDRESAPWPWDEVEDACVNDESKPMTLYVQVYDEATRLRAQELIAADERFARAVAIPEVENVVATAGRRKQAPPARWSQPTLLVHRPSEADDHACARALSTVLTDWLPEVQVKNLPPSVVSHRRVIELWIPPLDPQPVASE